MSAVVLEHGPDRTAAAWPWWAARALAVGWFAWLGLATAALGAGLAVLGADPVVAHLVALPLVALLPLVGWMAAGLAAVLAWGWPPGFGIALALTPLGLLWAAIRLPAAG